MRFFVFRPCSIGGLYILTDTGTADLEVPLDVNVLKNTFGGAATQKKRHHIGTDIDTDFADNIGTDIGTLECDFAGYGHEGSAKYVGADDA